MLLFVASTVIRESLSGAEEEKKENKGILALSVVGGINTYACRRHAHVQRDTERNVRYEQLALRMC